MHCIGIYLLLKIDYIKKHNRTQGFYILWLSIIEVAMNVSKIAVFLIPQNTMALLYVDMIRTGILAVQLMLILSVMTIDRAAFVILNLKYRSSWFPDIPKWVFLFACLSSFFLTLILLLFCDTKTEFSFVKNVIYWPMNDSIVVITFIVSYVSIIFYVRQQAKHMQQKRVMLFKKQVRQATKVPLLIVSCFIGLWTVSDIIHMIYKVLGREVPIYAEIICNLVTSLNYTLDAIFYIYFCRPIRELVNQKILNLKRRRGATSPKTPVEQHCRIDEHFPSVIYRGEEESEK